MIYYNGPWISSDQDVLFHTFTISSFYILVLNQIQKDRRCGHGPATHPRLFDISSFKSNLNYDFYGIFYHIFGNRGLR